MNDIDSGYLNKKIAQGGMDIEKVKDMFLQLPKKEQETFLITGKTEFISNELLDIWRTR